MNRLEQGVLSGAICVLIAVAFGFGYLSGQKVEIVSTKTITEYFPVASPFITVLHIRIVDDRDSNQGIANASLSFFIDHMPVELGQANATGYFVTGAKYDSRTTLTLLVSAPNYATHFTLVPIKGTPILVEMSRLAETTTTKANPA